MGNYFAVIRHRKSEYTKLVPKPMVKVARFYYSTYNETLFKVWFNDFIIATGYKRGI